MKPGLARAVPMGIIGLIAGLLFVIILRALQSVEPVWDAQLGFVVGAFTASFAFAWGMGAIDKRMSQHPHEPEVDKETGLVLYEPKEEHGEDVDAEAQKTPPGRVLSFNIWKVSYWQILLFVGLFAFATLPTGLNLQTTRNPGGNTAAIGYFEFTLPFTETTVTVSQLTLFAFFVFFTMASLYGIAWAIGRTFLALSKNVSEVRTAPDAVGRYSFAPEGEKSRNIPMFIQLVVLVVVYAVFIVVGYSFMFGEFLLFFKDPEIVRVMMTGVFTLLIGSIVYYAILKTEFSKLLIMIGVLYSAIFLTYLISYHILVGFVLYSPDWVWMRILASAGNAVAIGLLIFYLVYPKKVNRWVGRTAQNLLKMADPDANRPESDSSAIVPQSPEGN